jgi:hypothetical protein
MNVPECRGRPAWDIDPIVSHDHYELNVIRRAVIPQKVVIVGRTAPPALAFPGLATRFNGKVGQYFQPPPTLGESDRFTSYPIRRGLLSCL